ncbi:MAG TPA: DEAD/DEAH box helicase [Vicingaceae bacterium]
MTFKELGLDEHIVKAVEELGFEKPSPIQEESIPLLITGDKDYVGLAQTGTGKTAAFGLPMIQQIDTNSKAIQGMILCPTRELCLQITNELKLYAKHTKGIKVVAVYGGASISDQIREIKSGVNIMVGTPGRTIDLMERRVLKFDEVKTVVLDEADEMLNMGFKEDITKIIEQTPPSKYTWLFSATMPKEVERIAKNYMTDPVRVTVGTKNSSAANIEHQYCAVAGRDQYDALRRFIDVAPGMYGIVFCRTRRETKEIADKLMADGYNADALHGDLSQAQRDSVMAKFRNRNLQVLIATDVAARGIDVDDLTHVFHVDLPDEIESYTHRSGRTARAGKSGRSIALVSPSKASRVRLVEKQIGGKMELIQVPTGKEICFQQLMSVIQNVKEVEINEKGLAPYIAQIHEEFADISKEEIIERFVSLEFNRFIKDYEKARDLNIDMSTMRKGRDRGERGDRKRGERGDNTTRNTNRLFINIGKMDGFENKGQILGFICNQTGVDGNSIGKIDLFDSFAFIGVDDNVGNTLINSLNGRNIENRDIRIEFSKDKPRGERSDRGGDRGGYKGGGDRGGNRRERTSSRSSFKRERRS